MLQGEEGRKATGDRKMHQRKKKNKLEPPQVELFTAGKPVRKGGEEIKGRVQQIEDFVRPRRGFSGRKKAEEHQEKTSDGS